MIFAAGPRACAALCIVLVGVHRAHCAECAATASPADTTGADGNFYCINGGTIGGTTGDCTCTCAAGYSGLTCTTDIDECNPNPCQNAGTCVDGVNSYTCTLIAAFITCGAVPGDTKRFAGDSAADTECGNDCGGCFETITCGAVPGDTKRFAGDSAADTECGNDCGGCFEAVGVLFPLSWGKAESIHECTADRAKVPCRKTHHGNNICTPACNTDACDYDGGDCKCSEISGCPDEHSCVAGQCKYDIEWKECALTKCTKDRHCKSTGDSGCGEGYICYASYCSFVCTEWCSDSFGPNWIADEGLQLYGAPCRCRLKDTEVDLRKLVAGVTVGAFFFIMVIAAACSHKWWRVYFTRKIVARSKAVNMWRRSRNRAKILPGTPPVKKAKGSFFGGLLGVMEPTAEVEEGGLSAQPDNQNGFGNEYGGGPSSFGNEKPPSLQSKLPAQSGQARQFGNPTFGGAPMANPTKIVPTQRPTMMSSGDDEMNFPPPPAGTVHDVDADSYLSSASDTSA